MSTERGGHGAPPERPPASGTGSGSAGSGSGDTIRVAVIDDHTLFRRGVIALLLREPGVAIAGEAADGADNAGVVD